MQLKLICLLALVLSLVLISGCTKDSEVKPAVGEDNIDDTEPPAVQEPQETTTETIDITGAVTKEIVK